MWIQTSSLKAKSGHGDIGTSYRMMSLSVPPLS